MQTLGGPPSLLKLPRQEELDGTLMDLLIDGVWSIGNGWLVD